MNFDYEKLHRDIVVRLKSINKSQQYLADKLGIGRMTIWRLCKKSGCSADNFFKLVHWLDNPIERYIKK